MPRPSIPWNSPPPPEREAEDRFNAAMLTYIHLARIRHGLSDVWAFAAFKRDFPTFAIASDPAVARIAKPYMSTLMSTPTSRRSD
jgi:hypothetical protein